MKQSIRVLLFKEESLWVAQALEHDICVQGATLQDVRINFEVAIRLESAEVGGLARIPAAPEYFQDHWASVDGLLKPVNEKKADNFQYGLLAA